MVAVALTHWKVEFLRQAPRLVEEEVHSVVMELNRRKAVALMGEMPLE